MESAAENIAGGIAGEQPDPRVEELFSSAQIADRVRGIGEDIARDHPHAPPVLVAVLKGSSIFLADLIRAIDVPVTMDLMAISAFSGAAESAGRIRIMKDLDVDIADRDVILVEDIIDTGLTAAYLMATLRSRGPASVSACTLLDKSVRRIAPIELRYIGFECPDRFVVGYGLDHMERFRSLKAIYTVDDVAAVDERDVLAMDRLLASTVGDSVDIS